ncbi:hypothetical protein LTR27_012171 [Elasticomyces elasticus]|nr:hypothetical protein LTR27_012171 [Elasticomyces elasticus]
MNRFKNPHDDLVWGSVNHKDIVPGGLSMLGQGGAQAPDQNRDNKTDSGVSRHIPKQLQGRLSNFTPSTLSMFAAEAVNLIMSLSTRSFLNQRLIGGGKAFLGQLHVAILVLASPAYGLHYGVFPIQRDQ